MQHVTSYMSVYIVYMSVQSLVLYNVAKTLLEFVATNQEMAIRVNG